jgi:hypothetical protein
VSLRQFLYYDESLVNDFLAQLEGGQSGDVKKRAQVEKGRRGEASVGAGPARVGGGLGRSVTEETEAIIRQGRASNFERLYEQLVAADELTQIDDDLDEAAWSMIRRGSLIELETKVTVPQLARLFSDPAAFANLGALIKTISPESITPEAEKVIKMMGMLPKLGVGEGGTLTAVGNPPGTPYKLVMRLDRKFIVPGAELDGEATVLIKMARKLKADDKELVIDIPGMSTLGTGLRETLTESDDTGSFAVEGPGAIVVPIAVYR